MTVGTAERRRTIAARALRWLRRRRALHGYVTTAPNPQTVLDLFAEEWASRLPPPFGDLRAGDTALFEDPRITWAAGVLGGCAGKAVLDLGPLEGGHSYMFEQMGAQEVVAIEGNVRAYLRCLVTKELLGMRRVSFQCGDFVSYLRAPGRRFDIVNASGILYHQRNPAELLALCCKTADAVIIWTQYFDPDVVASRAWLRRRFTRVESLEYEGFRYEGHRQDYRKTARLPWYCGGNAPYSHWMAREDLLSCLRFFGMTTVSVSFDEKDHQNGPAIAVVARRARAERASLTSGAAP